MSLLIDIGSTNIKYMKTNGKIKSIPFPNALKEEYPFFEVDPIKIFEIIKSIIDSENEKKVFISVQMHGYILLNKGIEVTPYVSWRDERGKDIVPNFNITKEYGVNIKPNLPRLSIETWKIEFDEFTTLGSYIVYKLTGINKTHITDLSPSGFINVYKKRADYTSFKLPDFTKDIEIIGKYKDIDIYSPVGDQQASILGVTYYNDFKGYILNLGTAAQMCTISDTFIDGKYESRPYFFNKYLLTVTYLPGGAYFKKHDVEKEEDYIYTSWENALNSLPKRNCILVTGGLLNYKYDFIIKQLNKMNLKYIINNDLDALYGLDIIDKELNK